MPQRVKRRVMRLIRENKASPEEVAIVNIQLGQVVAEEVNWLGQTEGLRRKKGGGPNRWSRLNGEFENLVSTGR